MPSPTYRLFAQAMEDRKPVRCAYGGFRREVCPVILGHTDGEEMALTFQVGGESRSGLPAGGEWRCLSLAKVTAAVLCDGPWRSGDSHAAPQGCVREVDLDVNPASPYHPKRKLGG